MVVGPATAVTFVLMSGWGALKNRLPSLGIDAPFYETRFV
jgi:hypothetical protein